MNIAPLQFFGGTAERFTAVNPILKDREVGLEIDTHRFKVGDGRTKWNDLEYWISEVFIDAGDPTGFLDNQNITVTYNATTRKITLSHPSGLIEYYYKGVKRALVSPWTSDAHDTTTTAKYLYSTDGINFTWSDTAWEFTNIMVAYVAPNKIFAIREVHGVMPSTVHEELHRLLSTYRLSGFGLTAGTYVLQNASDANNTPSFDAGVIVDEDLRTSISAFTQGAYTLLSFSGSGTPVFELAQDLMVREILGDYPRLNSWDGTTFSDPEMTTNQFANIYILRFPVTADATSQQYRAVCLQPQKAYTSLASAEAEDFRSLYLGTLGTISPEFVVVERITIRTSTGYIGATGQYRLESYAILTGSRASQVSEAGFTSLTAQNVSVVPFSTIASTNVQDALEEIVAEAGGGGLLNNFTATTNPTVNDDSADGYSVGSIWINLTTDKIYQCTDATVGSALWKETTSVITDDAPSDGTTYGRKNGTWAQISAVVEYIYTSTWEFFDFANITTFNFTASGIILG